MAVIAVEQANHLGEISALHVLGGLGRERIELRRVGFSVGLYGGRNVLVAEVQHRK